MPACYIWPGCDATDVVLVPNVTMAVNCVLRSLPLGPGDELMYYNMEYGKIGWEYIQTAYIK